MKWMKLCIALYLLGICLCGCTSISPKESLVVSAAASLTDCMNEIKPLFEQQYANVELVYNFGGSGALSQQIAQGAPVDIFISAGKKQMDTLESAGLMDENSVKDLLKNKLVVIVPATANPITSFAQLAQCSQIGVGEPESVPAGQYAAQMLESLSLTDSLQGKLLYAKDVREIVAWVETGNVQAGIVYETDAKASDGVQICLTAPEDSHEPIVYPAGILRRSTVSYSETFMEFLYTDQAQNIFIKYGFQPLTP